MPTPAPKTTPHWRQSALGCPPAWRVWLLDTQSLTRRLQKHSAGDFSVTVSRQKLAKPRGDEAMALGIPHTQLALVREVILSGKGHPLVLARSVIPLKALNGKLRFLQTLGNRPLGEFLFRNPAIKRGPIWLTRWPESLLSDIPDSIFSEIKVQNRDCPQRHGTLWARYSIFRHQQAGILVSEVFLPNLIAETRDKTNPTCARLI